MQVGRAFGVGILVDKFFLLLLLIYGCLGLLPQAMTLFTIVFIHELAHVLVAWNYGYRVKEIELLPFGGVARIEDLDLASLDPEVEINIALAGPLQNLFWQGWLCPASLYGLAGKPATFLSIAIWVWLFSTCCLYYLWMGDVYRAYLVQRMGYKEATERVASYGSRAGICWALLVLPGSIFLGLVSAFSLYLFSFSGRPVGSG